MKVVLTITTVLSVALGICGYFSSGKSHEFLMAAFSAMLSVWAGIIVVSIWMARKSRKEVSRALLIFARQDVVDMHNHVLKRGIALLGDEAWNSLTKTYVERNGDPDYLSIANINVVASIALKNDVRDEEFEERCKRLAVTLSMMLEMGGWSLDHGLLVEGLAALTALRELSVILFAEDILLKKKELAEQVLDVYVHVSVLWNVLTNLANVKTT